MDNCQFPCTPATNNEKVGETTVLALIQAILISAMGEIILYEAEGYGRIFQDVVPIKHMEKEQTSVGSNTELEIHTEQAFSELRPDFISLGCLRSNSEAFTHILPVGKMVEDLTKMEISALYKPDWKTGVDLSFKINGYEFIEGDVRGPLSILTLGIDNTPILRFDQDLMYGLSLEAETLKKKIVDIYYSKRYSYCLQPGDIIFIDNNRAVHGRSAFLPRYDGQDRFLVRCFATADYRKSEYARPNGGRAVAAIYS